MLPFNYARARFLLCALVVSLAGCASHATGALIPQTSSYERNDTVMSVMPTSQAVAVNTGTVAGTIGLFQVFDEFTPNEISSSQAAADGHRYGAVWGARVGMASYWKTSNSAIAATYYMPQETDASFAAWGDIGHTLAWWQANHPDWILYACTSAGTPTKTPAYISGLPDNVPLDIHNPDVVAYQVKLAANYAIAEGYTGLAFDEVLFENVTGMGVASTDYGCGIYEGSTFVRRYTGRTDPAWTTDTVAWVKTARSILKTDSVIGPKNLKLIVNHPAANPITANEEAVLTNVDADVDEAGFSDYGNYKAAGMSGLAMATVKWMAYAQSVGTVPLIIDKFDQSAAVTSLQLEYSIATYLLGDTSSARLFVGNSPGYGAEQYHTEYATNFGAPCATYYGGATYDASNPNIYYRKFVNALVVVNPGSLPRASEVAHLPAGHTYTDLEHRTVTNPLTVNSSDAYVLLTTSGCS